MRYLFNILFLFSYLACFTQKSEVSPVTETPLKPDSNSVKALLQNAFRNDTNTEKSLEEIRLAFSMAEKINYKINDSVIKELYKYAEYYFDRSPETSRSFYSIGLKAARKQNYLAGIQDGLFLSGEHYFRKGLLDSALYFLRCAKGYCIKVNDTLLLDKINMGIENCYYVKGDAATGLWWSMIHERRLTFLDLDSVLFFGVYLGALLFCFIYNLFLFRFTHDKSYSVLAKCIFVYIIYVYTSNNDFSAQFSRNLYHFTIVEFFKSTCLLFGAYLFASFLENMLLNKKSELEKLYRFLKIYKKIVAIIIVASIVLMAISSIKNSNNITNYFEGFTAWFGWNALIGMICTIIVFTKLLTSVYKKNIRLNFLIYGLLANLLLLVLAFVQSAMRDKFSHIPYPHALGAAIFLIFMTVAIADKINLYRKEKEDAQQNALENLEKIVVERTFDLQQQKHVVEEKNKEITDSITYAKRLQNAILPPLNFISKHLPESFVVYKPKDIVAGDFYWCETIASSAFGVESGHSGFSSGTTTNATGNEQGTKRSELHSEKAGSVALNELTTPNSELIFIAAADCTGHGVPGAMVSVVCSNALNRSVKEFGITDPGKILDKTRELVLETFARSESEVKDGMDISLLCIDNKNKKVSWSGANNPLWYIHEGKLEEIKPDKQPIGKTDYAKPFTTHEITYKEGTIFYLFTDGLSDQFGGEKGKKLKHKQVKETLLENEKLSLSQQSEKLIKKFDGWKGSLEQVDDVCMIGIRV
jgi:serine phosphatase RsbU (regulator of sigma subunit)